MPQPKPDPDHRTGSYNPTLHGNDMSFVCWPNGGIAKVLYMPTRRAFGALRWLMQPHPTRNLPLSLGRVGRW